MEPSNRAWRPPEPGEERDLRADAAAAVTAENDRPHDPNLIVPPRRWHEQSGRAIDFMTGPTVAGWREQDETAARIDRWRRFPYRPDPQTSFGCSGPCCNRGRDMGSDT